ncbi:MAG: HAD family hydrolase [Phycisphaerales bacterium]|nr:HAD family hydrolase [Phycisphaerales bacterium]
MLIFDMDGTLTVPVLDFDAIRAEIGLPPGPILESLAQLDAAARSRADAVLEAHERRAAEGARLHAGAAETLAAVRQRGWPVAILTRNARRWAEHVIRRFDLAVDFLRTRDDGVIKPSPQPVLELCAAAQAAPRASWMIGDHLIDLQTGHAAGCTTVLMIGDRQRPDCADQADHVITRLSMLIDLLPPCQRPRTSR